MRVPAVPACILALTVVQLARAAGPALSATTYHVGPGQPRATPSDVPWESLVAGDSVLIHARAAPYRDKWVVNRAGTAAAPIVVRGAPDPVTGVLPVIDGQDATTRPQLDFWGENRGVIKIGGSNLPADGMPAWIAIENLEVRGGHTPFTFTGRNGLTAYAANAAAIYVEKGQHVTIRGCHLTGSGNGLFAAWETSELLVEGCWIEGNGNVGSIYEHNNYTEARGVTFQGNRFGPLLAGAGGNNLKDRSAGTVIRCNWIEGGNRQLDLVESDHPALLDDPRYRATFVYGNVLIERDGDGNSQVAHYGGDNGDASTYRKGTLWFHHNTVVSKRAGNTTLLRLSSAGENADVRDNVLFVTAAGNRLALLDQAGTLTATRNWMKAGWVPSHSGGPVGAIDAGQVTGTDPGFTDIAGEDFTPAPGSPLLDQAVALDLACLPAHAPVLRYVKHGALAPRGTLGAARDLGAFEAAGAVAVEPLPPALPARATATLRAWPNPSACEFHIGLEGVAPGAGGPPARAEVYDARGRRVARLEAVGVGRWRWVPGRGVRPGVYVVEVEGQALRLTRW